MLPCLWSEAFDPTQRVRTAYAPFEIWAGWLDPACSGTAMARTRPKSKPVVNVAKSYYFIFILGIFILGIFAISLK